MRHSRTSLCGGEVEYLACVDRVGLIGCYKNIYINMPTLECGNGISSQVSF